MTQHAPSFAWIASLVYARAPFTVDHLAAALGWPQDRVTSALRIAEHYPDITGPVTLQHTERGTYTMTARFDRLTMTQRQALRPSPGSCDALG